MNQVETFSVDFILHSPKLRNIEDSSNLWQNDGWPSDKIFPYQHLLGTSQREKQTPPGSSVWIIYICCSETLISKTINRMTILNVYQAIIVIKVIRGAVIVGDRGQQGGSIPEGREEPIEISDGRIMRQ